MGEYEEMKKQLKDNVQKCLEEKQDMKNLKLITVQSFF